jgi:hypothetical protein
VPPGFPGGVPGEPGIPGALGCVSGLCPGPGAFGFPVVFGGTALPGVLLPGIPGTIGGVLGLLGAVGLACPGLPGGGGVGLACPGLPAGGADAGGAACPITDGEPTKNIIAPAAAAVITCLCNAFISIPPSTSAAQPDDSRHLPGSRTLGAMLGASAGCDPFRELPTQCGGHSANGVEFESPFSQRRLD